MTDPVPFRTWSEHLSELDWRQGEHVAMVGPTGQGKTTAALQLLERRGHVAIIATKPRDRTLQNLRRRGYNIIRTWPPPNDAARRVILWPKFRTPEDMGTQAAVINRALLDIFRAGAWCVFADDVQYLPRSLNLGGTLSTLWLQARALDVSVMAATQRPRWVPLEMWSQSTHIYIWRTRDRDDLRRISGLGAHDPQLVRDIVPDLPPYHCVYIDTRRDGTMHTTKPELR